MPITSNNVHQRVTLYLGDGQKNMKLVENNLLSALASYVHRVGNSSKNIDNYPLVFADKAALQSFLTLREINTDASCDAEPVMTGDVGKDSARRLLHVLRTVRAVTASDFTFSADQKIYIVGNGDVALNYIRVGDNIFTMQDIAKTLSDIGVPKDIRDVRLASGASADATEVPDIRAPDLAHHSFSVNETSFLMSLLPWGNKAIRKAPAQHLAEALTEHHFNKVTVTGYHGRGIYQDRVQVPHYHMRNTHVPTQEGFDPKATVRRSTVAEKFTNA